MRTPIAIVLAAVILAVSYVLVHRYQQVGDPGGLEIYRDILTGDLYAVDEIEQFRDASFYNFEFRRLGDQKKAD